MFRYCYKTQRKSFWCNKFITNKTQRKIFPYMIEYFILQLTTIGFEKQYEKFKNENEHRITWTVIFISSFILFLYLTRSFTRMFCWDNKFDDEDEEDKDKENGEKKFTKKEAITKLSNEILNGTHGILLFNGVFSLIFSSFYLSHISEDIKEFFFRKNINIIFMPILMNKFYYFTLNYYCIFTAEKYKKFEIISNSSLISIYIAIWNLILTLIKTSIPDEVNSDEYNYYNILYIIQIVFSSIPALGVVIFILIGLFFSSGLKDYLNDCSCEDCAYNFSLHKFLFCLFSFIFCCGGCWIRLNDYDFQDYKYECCGVDECCDIGGDCSNVYCIDNVIFCECCCCDKKSKCYSDCCYKHCDHCDICGCCRENN